jgi:hypothetical protein
MTHDETINANKTELQKLREELAEEAEAAENWRRLALQFDNHRMQALGHLKAVVNPEAVFDAYKTAKAFLNAAPLDGEEVLAQRIAELAAAQAADTGNPVPESDVPVPLPEPDAYLYVNGNHRGVSLEWRSDMDLSAGTERHALYTEKQCRALLPKHPRKSCCLSLFQAECAL